MKMDTKSILFFTVLLINFNCIFASTKQLFISGNEYKYYVHILVTTGTEEPTSFTSSYKLTELLNVQAVDSTTLKLQFVGPTIGVYNGKWKYFPLPEFTNFPTEELNGLTEPFQITLLENGKFKSLMMNDQEPEWASNMKRGLATYLQMDMEKVSSLDKVSSFKTDEFTTMGECSTLYKVLPTTVSGAGIAQVTKFRNHADCPDVPKRVRQATRNFYPCTDDTTKNIVNSTAYATYDFGQEATGIITMKQVVIYSSMLYWPFTANGQLQYSWFSLALVLQSVTPTTEIISSPENAETHEELSYVFEQSDFDTVDTEEEVPDLKAVEPLLFHHNAVDSEPETLEKTTELLYKTVDEIADSLLIPTYAFANSSEFHKHSPFGLIPIVSSLDFDSLWKSYEKYSASAANGDKEMTEYKLFLDGLYLSGTSAATLTIRDILLTSKDTSVLNRLIPSFPRYIRTPSEHLGKELDPIFDLVKKTSLSSTTRQMLEFAMATIVSRCCSKTLCTSSGLLDKYIGYFEEKLNSTRSEEQTVGVLGLRNLGVGRSLEKVLEIAQGTTVVERSVRVQSIWALRHLAYKNHSLIFNTMLPVFYNRSESCEIRTSVFSFLMGSAPDIRMLHDVAYYMWTETCAQTRNIVRSTLLLMANTKFPCNPLGAQARTILQYLPSEQLDPTRTQNYVVDYYDKQNGFGHMEFIAVQKSGKSFMPVSIYYGLANYVGGFVNSYVGVYLRVEGLVKAVADKIAEMRAENLEDIQEILTTIGITARKSTPLKLELTIIYHDRVVMHYSADEDVFLKLPMLIKKVTEIGSELKVHMQKSTILGGVLYQQPLEIGVPVSLLVSVTAIGGLSLNVNGKRSGAKLSAQTDGNLQYHLFGLSSIINHMPAISTKHSITSLRTFRMRIPFKRAINVDVTSGKYSIDNIYFFQNRTDPVTLRYHATTVTSISADSAIPLKNQEAFDILAKSCPTCQPTSVVSKGSQYRKTRSLPIKAPKTLTGVKAGIVYFDCERDHSRGSVVRKLQNFFDTSNMNIETSSWSKVHSRIGLGLTHLREFLFYSPYGETCGLTAYAYVDDSIPTRVDNVTLTLKIKRSAQVHSNLKRKAEYDIKLTLFYTDSETRSADMNFIMETIDFNHRALQLKYLGTDSKSKSQTIVCTNTKVFTKILSQDPYDYVEENEPEIREDSWATIGRFETEKFNLETTAKEAECLDNWLRVKVDGLASRSIEQRNISEAAQVGNYKECAEQRRNSTLFPGTFVPPTSACISASVEQCAVRAVNVTIKYKMSDAAKKEIPILKLLEAPKILHEYFGFHSEQDDSSSSSEELSVGQNQIEYNLNINEDFGPQLDFSYSHAKHKEHTVRGVDLSILPEWMIKPLQSRFSPMVLYALKMGALGQCDITSGGWVHTFDNFTYTGANLKEKCPTLLSGDCGEIPQFAVLGRKMSSGKMEVTVYIGQHKILLDGSSSPEIDDTPTAITDKELFTHGQDSSPAFSVVKNGDDFTMFSVPHGILVRYTGYFTTILLAGSHRGTTCGLCGNWDSTSTNDLTSPQESCAKKMLTPIEMVEAYVVSKNSSCTNKSCPTN